LLLGKEFYEVLNRSLYNNLLFTPLRLGSITWYFS
jgi:hypothetical protein